MRDVEGPGTKQKIFDEAVRMFSENGYKHVSVRDLARATGIQAASIYNHYPSKSKILEELYNYFYEVEDGTRPSLDVLLEMVETRPPADILNMINGHYSGFDEKMLRIAAIATDASRTDESSCAFVRRIFFDLPRHYIDAVLDKMIKSKRIEPFDYKAFRSLYAGMCFNATKRCATNFPIDPKEGAAAWKLLMTLIKPITVEQKGEDGKA
ncbi:MAG: TetR/AcrR family transcriptional regulator [Clostridiales bacterium]|jgi:AcrR family transcriptional regulator|nr:TetR/AcrR family transcriptional regulator [Clostridiales bacterium]